MECRFFFHSHLSNLLNDLQSSGYPMLSTSIFSANGSIYDQAAVFGSNFELNETALAEVGLPVLTGANAWANLTANLAVSPLDGVQSLSTRASDLTLRSVA